jgi:L-alanine-DL-glutamate epimerase-like enolase superfamily enzyme
MEITAVELVEFEYPLADVDRVDASGKLVYAPGETHRRTTCAVRIETDGGVTGEYVGGSPVAMAQMEQVAGTLPGRDPARRERIRADLRRSLRAFDGVGIGPIDVALWDIAGKRYGAPIHELLGTYRDRLPAYASTYFAREGGGFATPEEFAAFAETCADRGFPAFKLHTWTGRRQPDVDREVETVRTVAEAVGDRMALMHDPVCEYETLARALEVGRACAEAGYAWYEDPYADGGSSRHGHRLLRERLDVPLLQTELVRGLEAHADFAVADATDFLRADVAWDGGITGAIRIARVAEGLGLDVEYHLAGPAQRHCMAATRNSNYYEFGLVHPESDRPHTAPPVYAGDYEECLAALGPNGTVPVPDGPGLGVDYDWAYVRANERRRRRVE